MRRARGNWERNDDDDDDAHGTPGAWAGQTRLEAAAARRPPRRELPWLWHRAPFALDPRAWLAAPGTQSKAPSSPRHAIRRRNGGEASEVGEGPRRPPIEWCKRPSDAPARASRRWATAGWACWGVWIRARPHGPADFLPCVGERRVRALATTDAHARCSRREHPAAGPARLLHAETSRARNRPTDPRSPTASDASRPPPASTVVRRAKGRRGPAVTAAAICGGARCFLPPRFRFTFSPCPTPSNHHPRASSLRAGLSQQQEQPRVCCAARKKPALAATWEANAPSDNDETTGAGPGLPGGPGLRDPVHPQDAPQQRHG